MNDIQSELKEFKIFKKNFTFKQMETTNVDGKIYFNDLIIDDGEGNIVGESNDFINVGYKIKGSMSKLLSNLFPYEFEFKGLQLQCIENFFQGIKFPKIQEQNLVLKYKGLDSCNIKDASTYNWEKNHIIYWQGSPIDRMSEEYDDLVDELYISAIQNPLYRNAIKKCNKYILHSIGNINKEETVFTRYEFEKMLNTLHAFLNR